jgi:hypothetical protein
VSLHDVRGSLVVTRTSPTLTIFKEVNIGIHLHLRVPRLFLTVFSYLCFTFVIAYVLEVFPCILLERFHLVIRLIFVIRVA